jgi:bifunctional UDP-N-acetylglucosamine pyrophosphorylase/glucosamine-1-phosphate N-acetyltransferase
VGDSVVMDGCSMGSGAVTANLRLDEQSVKLRVGPHTVDTGTSKFGVIMGEGSRLGVQASTMPGTRVGAGAFVGPAVCLREDLEPGKMILLRQDTEIRQAPALDASGREDMRRTLKR